MCMLRKAFRGDPWFHIMERQYQTHSETVEIYEEQAGIKNAGSGSIAHSLIHVMF